MESVLRYIRRNHRLPPPPHRFNVGGSIGFTATGNDGEGDNYFLIICAGNKATSTGVYPYTPTCVASTQFCVSAKASSTVAAACTYNNVADPGYLTQTQAWYAFLCDDHLAVRNAQLTRAAATRPTTPLIKVTAVPTLPVLSMLITHRI